MKKHLKNLEKLARELFKKADLIEEITDIKIEHQPKEEIIYINISTEKPSFLIGYRGKNLYALEHLLKSLYFKRHQELPRLVFDICDYKKKNISRLEYLAQKVADQVGRSGRPEVLMPMNAYERRAVHTHIVSKFPNLASESIGEEPNRRVVVKVKNPKS